MKGLLKTYHLAAWLGATLLVGTACLASGCGDDVGEPGGDDETGASDESNLGGGGAGGDPASRRNPMMYSTVSMCPPPDCDPQ